MKNIIKIIFLAIVSAALAIVVEQLIVHLKAEPEECFFWATQSGAELDLLIVRMLSDILANLLTTSLYLQDKTHDPLKFNQFEEEMMPCCNKENEENIVCSSSGIVTNN